MSRRRTRLLLSLAIVPILCASPLLAEDIDPATLFESAKTAYGEKKYGKALQDLNLLVREIGRLRMESLKSTLPGAPEGWTAQESEGDMSTMGLAIFGAGLTVQRQYSKGEESRVTIELMADSPLVASISMWIQNPAFLPPGAQTITLKGRRAVLQYDKEGRSGEISLVLNAGTTLLKISGQSISKEDIATTFANLLDLDRIERALQQ